MNRRDLVLAVRDQMGGTSKDAEKAVDEVLGMIQAGLVKEGKVRLNGFGTFAVVGHNARQGRNPRTGEAIQVPAQRNVRFKLAAGLKESLNR